MWRRKLDTARLVSCVYARPRSVSDLSQCIAGWTTTEVGRQPWTIYGLMRTAESVSPSLTGHDVIVSLLLYMLVYLIIFPVGPCGDVADRQARAWSSGTHVSD